mmetsp:Transcript_13948/g.23042  ORF Transcript_13948/g.23042 Transcript_13948/m.23042 type:complete len:384 (+) Transcript_13948:124-1275(+)
MVIRIDILPDPRVILKVTNKQGGVSTCRMLYEDADALQAVYSREEWRCCVIARPRLLSECLAIFISNIDEITFQASSAALRVRSFVDAAKGAKDGQLKNTAKSLQTDISIDARDFQEYEVTSGDLEITFSLRELRAMLAFCEASSLDVQIRFDGAGKPILFSTHTSGPVFFDADFVVATLADFSEGSQSQAPVSQSQPQRHPPQSVADNDDDQGESQAGPNAAAQPASSQRRKTKLADSLRGEALAAWRKQEAKEAEAEAEAEEESECLHDVVPPPSASEQRHIRKNTEHQKHMRPPPHQEPHKAAANTGEATTPAKSNPNSKSSRSKFMETHSTASPASTHSHSNSHSAQQPHPPHAKRSYEEAQETGRATADKSKTTKRSR